MTDEMEEAGDMALGWESAKSMVAKLVQAVIGFVGTIVFARALGPMSFGGFYFLFTLVLITDRPLRGVSQSVQKRYSETSAPRDRIMGAALAISAVYFLLAGVVAFALGERLVDATNVDGAPIVFVSLLVTVGSFFPFQRMLGARGLVGKQTWNDTLRSILTLPLQLVFVGLGYGAAGMGYGLALATALTVPTALYFLSARPTLPDRLTLLSMWDYARYSIPAAFVGKAYDRIDTLVLGILLSTTAVGYYEVALKLTVPATFLPGVIASGLMPKISNLDSRDENVSSDVSNAIAYISMFSIPIFFGALALPRQLVVTPYGSEYSQAAALLIGLALYQVIWSQTRVYQKTLNGLNLPEVGLRIDAISLALNVVVGVLLVLEFGVIGVVVATVLAETLRLLLSAHSVSRRITDVDMLPRPLVKQVVAGVTMFLAVEVASRSVSLRTLPRVAVVVSMGAAVYLLVLITISPGLRFTVRAVYQDAVTAWNS